MHQSPIMNFPKSTREIIYDIKDYINRYEYSGCCNVVMSVNNDEITGKDIKITSNKKIMCDKKQHRPYTLWDKIDYYLWMIVSVIYTFGFAIIYYAVRDPYVGCIKLNIKSRDRDLLEQLKLYFGNKTTRHLSKDFIHVKIKFFYI